MCVRACGCVLVCLSMQIRGVYTGGVVGGRRGKNHLVKEKIRLGGWKGVGRVLR